MSKVRVQQILVGGMLVVLAIRLPVLLRSVGLLGQPPSRTSASGVMPTAHSQAPPSVPGAVQKSVEPAKGAAPESAGAIEPLVPAVTYTAETVRDPLVSLLTKKDAEPPQAASSAGSGAGAPAVPPQPPPVRVDGVIWGGARPQALLNGQAYEVGDMVAGAKIVAITQQGVTVEIGGARFLMSPSSGSGSSTNETEHQG